MKKKKVSLTYKPRATKTNPNKTSRWIKDLNVKYFQKKLQEQGRFPKEDTKSTDYKVIDKSFHIKK